MASLVSEDFSLLDEPLPVRAANPGPKPPVQVVRISEEGDARPQHGFAPLQFACKVDGEHTEFVIDPFADKILVSITQCNALGGLATATVEENKEASHGEPSFQVEVLLGDRQDAALLVLARRLAEDLLQSGCRKRLLLSLALRSAGAEESSAERMRRVRPLLAVLLQNKTW